MNTPIFAFMLGIVVCGSTSAVVAGAGTDASQGCTSFAGAYAYPGRVGLPFSCSVNTLSNTGLYLPAEHGFFQVSANPHPLVVEQFGCERLVMRGKRTVALQTEELAYADMDRSVTIDLTPAKDRKVVWGANALTWRQRYTSAGFRFPPWRKEWMELRLKKLPDGSLEYDLRQEGPHGKLIGEVRCVLPPAP